MTKQNQIGGNREGRKVCFGKSDEFIMIDITCTYKHHVISSMVCLNIVRQVITFDGHNVSFWSKNHATGYEAGLIENKSLHAGKLRDTYLGKQLHEGGL